MGDSSYGENGTDLVGGLGAGAEKDSRVASGAASSSVATPTTAPVRSVVMDVPSATSCSPRPVQITVARIAGSWSSAMPIFFTTAVLDGEWYADITSTAPSPKICRGGSTKFPAANSRNASRTAAIATGIGTVRRTSSTLSTFIGRRGYSVACGPDSPG